MKVVLLFAVLSLLLLGGCSMDDSLAQLAAACDAGKQSACIDYASAQADQRQAWANVAASARQTQANFGMWQAANTAAAFAPQPMYVPQF